MGNVKKMCNLRNLNLGVRNYMLPTLKGINKEGYAAMEHTILIRRPLRCAFCCAFPTPFAKSNLSFDYCSAATISRES